MDIEDIRDRESLEAWLKTRPREDAVAIAHRAALRVFPLFGRAMREGWARERELTCLPVLRFLTFPAVEMKSPTPELTKAVASALSDVMPSDPISLAADTATLSAAAAARSAADYENAAYLAAMSAGSAASSTRALAISASAAKNLELYLWRTVYADIRTLAEGFDVVENSLWPDTPPGWFTKADQETRAIWAENPEHWEFWTRWWDAVIAGKPLDWDLQRDIALIPDEVWQQGPGPVAVEIARLEELHNLRRELAELKRRIEQPEQVIEAIAGADLRGHNNPPELIETPAELRETLVVVWEGLREAESELVKSSPQLARLQQAGRAILSAAMSIATYCLEVGDVVVKNAAKGVGAALGVGVVAAILSNLPAIMTFAEKLIAFGAR